MQPAEVRPGNGRANNRVGRRDRATAPISAQTMARRSSECAECPSGSVEAFLRRTLKFMPHYLYNYVDYVVKDVSAGLGYDKVPVSAPPPVGEDSSVFIDLLHQRLVVRQRSQPLPGEPVEQHIRRGGG